MSGMAGSTPSPMQSSAPTPPPVMNNGPATSMSMNSPMIAAKRPVLESNEVLDKKRLQELVKEVDPNEQLDEEVENMLLQIADDFIEQTVTSACALAKHRKANNIEVEDVQFVLEKNWNMWIPGFGFSDIRQRKKPAATESHKARLAIIRKSLRKY